MGLPDFKGRFSEARFRVSAGTPIGLDPTSYKSLLKGDLKQWVKGQVGEYFTNASFAEEMCYRFPRDLPAAPLAAAGAGGTVGVGEASFIYLDVGAWVGGGGPWGERNCIKRDFGIICGPHVLLCTFEKVMNLTKNPCSASRGDAAHAGGGRPGVGGGEAGSGQGRPWGKSAH